MECNLDCERVCKRAERDQGRQQASDETDDKRDDEIRRVEQALLVGGAACQGFAAPEGYNGSDDLAHRAKKPIEQQPDQNLGVVVGHEPPNASPFRHFAKEMLNSLFRQAQNSIEVVSARMMGPSSVSNDCQLGRSERWLGAVTSFSGV
jgi:hypothetical protein